MKHASGLRIFAMCLPLAVTSCDRVSRQASSDPEWIRLEGLRVEAAQKISVATIKLGRLDRLRLNDDTIVNETLSGLRARSKDLAARRHQLELDIASLDVRLAEARDQVREAARAAAVGREYPKLDTRTGNHYENVRILAVTDSGVKISHSSGFSHLGSDDLEPAMCELVGLDRNLEIAANARLDRQQALFEQQVARDLAAEAAARPAPVALASYSTSAALSRSQSYSNPYRTSAGFERSTLSALDQPVRPISSGYSSSYYRSYYPTTRYYYVWYPTSYYRNYSSTTCQPRSQTQPQPRPGRSSSPPPSVAPVTPPHSLQKTTSPTSVTP